MEPVGQTAGGASMRPINAPDGVNHLCPTLRVQSTPKHISTFQLVKVGLVTANVRSQTHIVPRNRIGLSMRQTMRSMLRHVFCHGRGVPPEHGPVR